MNNQSTPETDALAKNLIPIVEKITEFNAQYVIKQILTEILIKTTKMERERDEARRKLNNLDVTAIHSCHNECQRPICVLRRERDEAREALAKILKNE